MSDRREKGRALMGRAFEGAPGGGRMPKRLLDYRVERLFGDVWQQDDLTLQKRSLTTCTVLVALGQPSSPPLPSP